MLQSQDEIIQQWTKYCSSLYKDQGVGASMIKDLEMITPTSTGEPPNISYSGLEREHHLRRMEQVCSSTNTQKGRSKSVWKLQKNLPHQPYRKNPTNRTTQQTQTTTRASPL